MKSCYLFFLLFLACFSNLFAQSPITVPFTESFTAGLNGWRVNGVNTHDWQWYNNVGFNDLGGLRMKLPVDSNYIASPKIALQAGKTYTAFFKARMAQSTGTRLVSVGVNTVRSLKGTSVFFSDYLPYSSYNILPFKDLNPTFTVPTSGNYYLTFNFTENGYIYTYLDEIGVEETQFPSVSMTAPTNGGNMNESYADSTKIVLAATASDVDGTISKVEFYANNVKIGEDLTAPYQYLWKDVLPKDYIFTAKAIDEQDNATISLPTNYRVNFRDGTLKKYVHWDFNLTNTVGKGLEYWTLSGGDWKLTSPQFHGTDGIEDFSSYAKNYAASPGVSLQAGQTYQLEFVGKGGNDIIKLFMNKKQALNDSIPIDTVMIKFGEDFKVIHQKTFTVPQSGTYHLIIHCPKIENYTQIKMDNIRIIGNGLNIAPLSKITSPNANLTAAEKSSMTLKSSPIDMDGSIQKVEYYANETKVGESSVPPNYEAVWQNIPLGNYKLTARPIDNENSQANSLVTTIRVDTNQFAASSLLGSIDDDDIRGIVYQKNGTIVMAANMGNISGLNIPTKFLNGATSDSTGVILRVASDGKSILSMTRLCTKIADIAKDNNDNIYVAAWKSGIFKLNATTDSVRWRKTFVKPVHRIDTGPSGKNISMSAIETDINDGTITQTESYLHDENGNLLFQYPGVSQYGADVAIDEASQTIIRIGFKNFNTYGELGGTQTLPVFVPVVRANTYNGIEKYLLYDWVSDTTSVRWINRSDNNMADARLNRCIIGKDGKLYLMGQIYGGNHCFRYDAFDIRKKAIVVGGDYYFSLSNTNTESHVFVGRYDPATGIEDHGQTFTARLPLGRGNSVFIDQGGIDVDSSGRIYGTGLKCMLCFYE